MMPIPKPHDLLRRMSLTYYCLRMGEINTGRSFLEA